VGADATPLSRRLSAAANRSLGRLGLQVVRSERLRGLVSRDAIGALAAPTSESLGEDPLLTPVEVRSSPEAPHPELRSDHPRLVELRRRYAGHPATVRSVWTDDFLVRELALERFRADNAYVWQERDLVVATAENQQTLLRARYVNYLLSAYYVRAADELRLLERLAEDGAFGNVTVAIEEDWVVSRDLLDSVLEINFLERHLGLASRPPLEVIDVGAGYGRLAHRLTAALENVSRVLCTDAVAESTFLCDFYLRFRGIEDRAEAVALDEVESRLSRAAPLIATNIHSFAECPLAAITWWVDLLAANEVPYLFLVANTDELASTEPDRRHRDFKPLLRSRGYRELAVEAKYARSEGVQRHGIFPAYYHLYAREALG
jgi:hypothetical protein